MDTRALDQACRDAIETSIPAIRDSSNLARAQLLRRWAHQTTPLSGPGSNLEETYRAGIAYEPPHLLLPALFQRNGGFECAGVSYVLRAACQLFDLPAYAMNMGLVAHNLSHCVTLVRLADGGASRVVVQDAHFNTEWLVDGEVASVEQLLDALAARQDDRIGVAPHDGSTRPGLVQLTQQASVQEDWVESYAGRELRKTADQVEYELTFSLERFRYRHLYEAELQRSFGTPNLAALMLLPLGTSGELEAEEIAAKARDAADRRLHPDAKRREPPRARTWRQRIGL